MPGSGGHRNHESLTESAVGVSPAGTVGERKDKDLVPSAFKWKDGETTEDGVVDQENMMQNSPGTMKTARQASYRRIASSSATTIKQHQNQELSVADIALAPTKHLNDVKLPASTLHAVDLPTASAMEDVSESQVSSVTSPMRGRSEVPSGLGSRGGYGELKIPARITQQQNALKRDLNAVREFASCVSGASTCFRCVVSDPES